MNPPEAKSPAKIVGEGRRIGKPGARATTRAAERLSSSSPACSVPSARSGHHVRDAGGEWPAALSQGYPISNQPWKRMAATIARNVQKHPKGSADQHQEQFAETFHQCGPFASRPDRVFANRGFRL